jgi:hypothetical protein
MKRNNRPSIGRYNVGHKYVSQLISAYGLCGKAFKPKELKVVSTPKESKVDFNAHIKQYFKKEVNRFNKTFIELDVVSEELIFTYAKRSTYHKHPLHYCDKCNDVSEYYILIDNRLDCKKCNMNKVNKWISNKRKTDEVFKFNSNIRTLISQSLSNNGYKKNSRTAEILGCDFNTFKLHIERKFTKGMSWSNYGKWHLDHIYPISKATSEEMALQLNHYTNFQPLWAKDNISKKDKIVEHQMLLPI